MTQVLVTTESSLFIAVAIVFAIVAHPQTYLLVHKLAKKVSGPNVITAYGVSTTAGLLAHALVAALLVTVILRFQFI